jgi:MerR family transcriptional regulator, light-induced transcriptional regulator
MRRTGLSADVLRVWERRYGAVTPARSPSGRRIYSDADIERLRLLYRGTLAGRTIGQIADLNTDALLGLLQEDARAEGATPHAESTPAAESPVDELLAGCVRAVERLDAAALDALLRRAVIMLPAAALLESLIAPFLAQLGTRWQEGSLRPVHEHLATAVVRRVLDRITETAASPVSGPTIVVATPAGAAHEFGALLAAATAAAEGWRPTHLGIGLPADDIAEAAATTKARAIALSIVYPPYDRAIAHELRRLGAAVPRGATLFVGGAAAEAYADVLNEIGAEHPASLGAFQRRLRELGRPRSRSR